MVGERDRGGGRQVEISTIKYAVEKNEETLQEMLDRQTIRRHKEYLKLFASVCMHVCIQSRYVNLRETRLKRCVVMLYAHYHPCLSLKYGEVHVFRLTSNNWAHNNG